jgi:hypothetical protein
MFGSDQMVWPEGIGMASEGIESASFLTEEQKRDIFYNNAVRFLRLDEEKLAHGSSKSRLAMGTNDGVYALVGSPARG